MDHLNGGYWLLANAPVWATALVLYMGTMGVLFAGRNRLEGMPYQVSYSAQLGDGALFVIVLLAAGILQRGGAVPHWLGQLDGSEHIVLMAVCMMLGVLVSFATHKSRSGQATDVYHDVVIAPVILYFAITLVPVVWTSGNDIEWVAMVELAGLWLVFVIKDSREKRLDQRSWLLGHAHRSSTTGGARRRADVQLLGRFVRCIGWSAPSCSFDHTYRHALE